jgi:hypothetical protein
MSKMFASMRHAHVGLDFADALEQRMARLSEDAQSVRPADKPTESFTTAGDDDLAASLSKRLASSVDTDGDADALPVDRDAPLSRAPFLP